MVRNGELQKNYHILTAKEACSLDPARYRVPPPDALRMLRPGHVVKLLVDTANNKGEEVWVAVTYRRNANFIGMVHGELGRTQHHGLYKGCAVKFRDRNVLDVLFQLPKDTPKSVRII
jgi:hypothetical protein